MKKVLEFLSNGASTVIALLIVFCIIGSPFFYLNKKMNECDERLELIKKGNDVMKNKVDSLAREVESVKLNDTIILEGAIKMQEEVGSLKSEVKRLKRDVDDIYIYD